MRLHIARLSVAAAICLLLCGLVIAGTVSAQALPDEQSATVAAPDAGASFAEEGVTEAETLETGAGETSPIADEEAPLSAEEEARRAAEEAERIARLSAERLRLEERSTELQYEHGIYSPVLMEHYADLGALLIQLGDYEAAAGYYNEALQIVRINTGLYSEQQFPVLLSLIDSHQLNEDWQRADDAAHLYMHMHRRLYDRHHPALLAAAEDFGKWRLRLLNENLLDWNTRGRLEMATELSEFYGYLLEEPEIEDNTESAPAEPGLSADWQLNLLETKTHADLMLARAIANTPASAFGSLEPRYIYQTRCRMVPNAQGQAARECFQVRVDNPRYYRSTRDAKRNEMGRYTRQVERSLDRMIALQDSASDLSASERESLNARIDDMRTAVREIDRIATRSLLNY